MGSADRWVYVFRSANGLSKIGRTRNVQARLRALRTLSPVDIQMVWITQTDNAPTLELWLHQRFAAKRSHGEWFALSDEDIKGLDEQLPSLLRDAIVKAEPDHAGLRTIALTQGGYFDRRTAHAHGVDDSLLAYHVRNGRFERMATGVYRIRDAPIERHDELLFAIVWTNHRGVISHESALMLYDLSDVMPSRVNITVPPSFRRKVLPYFELHWSRLRRDEVTTYEGVPVTTPERAIVEATSWGTGLEQIHMAVEQALDRGLVSREELRMAAQRSGYRSSRTVRRVIEAAITNAAA